MEKEEKYREEQYSAGRKPAGNDSTDGGNDMKVELHPWVAYLVARFKWVQEQHQEQQLRGSGEAAAISGGRRRQNRGNTRVDVVASRSSAPFFKVLPGMRHANGSDYDPTLFSFGPYHATLALPVPLGNHYKIEAAMTLTSPPSFQALVHHITFHDPLITALYADQAWDLASDPALRAHLLALDALFLVSAPSLLKMPMGFPKKLFSIVSHDALLLENQIPLFLLQAAFSTLTNPPAAPAPTSPNAITINSAAAAAPPHNQPPTNPAARHPFIKQVLDKYLSHCGYPFQSHLQHLSHHPLSDENYCLQHSMLTYIYHTLILNLPNSAEDASPTFVEPLPSSADDDVLDQPDAAQRSQLTWQLMQRELHTDSYNSSSTAAEELLQGAVMNSDVMDMLVEFHPVQSPPDLITIPRIPSACALARSGICVVGTPKYGFREMRYKNRVLALPQLTMYENTKSLLLNLLAYEATGGAEGLQPVTSYVVLMSYLLQSEEDVQELVDRHVIELSHMAGGCSHADFGKMWKTLIEKLPSYSATDRKLAQISKDVNTDCELARYHWSPAAWRYRVRKWSIAFVERYWEKQPWLLLSIITAFLLLALTVVQTVYTVLQYRSRPI